MKLAISNIAWTQQEEPEIAKLLQRLGVKYVEIAPTKLWDEPSHASKQAIEDYKEFWRKHDIEVVAFQSMLFNRPDLILFGSNNLRQDTMNYLKKYIDLAHLFDVKVMVFGSPKNRLLNGLQFNEAQDIAVQFFKELGDHAFAKGVKFCIEPNAEQYGCNFITNAKQGQELINNIKSPGIGLHLDMGCMSLAKDPVYESIETSSTILEHFHVSSPMLEQVEYREDVRHREAAEALKAIKYDKFVSIEMRPDQNNIDRVLSAVTFVQNCYQPT